MTTATTTTETPSGSLVEAKTICLVLTISTFGNTRQASMANVTVDADKKLLRMSKTLLDSPELEAIKKHDRAVAASIRKIAFPSLFKGGVYRVPIAMVTTVEDILKTALAERADLVEKACATYEQRVAETAARLGITCNLSDYPSVDEFRASFVMEHSYVTFDTPTRLKAISAALFEIETEKARVRLDSVAEECQQAMRAGLLSLVDHLAERLTPTDDGKSKKRLSRSTIANLNEFLATFDLRNVTDDSQLSDIVAKARNIMAGVNHEVLKGDDSVREKVMTELQAVKTALDPLVVEKTRWITFEEEA